MRSIILIVALARKVLEAESRSIDMAHCVVECTGVCDSALGMVASDMSR
jgi:hypothetical protein